MNETPVTISFTTTDANVLDLVMRVLTAKNPSTLDLTRIDPGPGMGFTPEFGSDNPGEITQGF